MPVEDRAGGEQLPASGNPPGEYTIELAIRDQLAPKKEQYSVQTADFEIR
jgi:hypothetical protein